MNKLFIYIKSVQLGPFLRLLYQHISYGFSHFFKSKSIVPYPFSNTFPNECCIFFLIICIYLRISHMFLYSIYDHGCRNNINIILFTFITYYITIFKNVFIKEIKNSLPDGGGIIRTFTLFTQRFIIIVHPLYRVTKPIILCLFLCLFSVFSFLISLIPFIFLSPFNSAFLFLIIYPIKLFYLSFLFPTRSLICNMFF